MTAEVILSIRVIPRSKKTEFARMRGGTSRLKRVAMAGVTADAVRAAIT